MAAEWIPRGPPRPPRRLRENLLNGPQPTLTTAAVAALEQQVRRQADRLASLEQRITSLDGPAEVEPEPTSAGHLLFVPADSGYEVLELEGAVPAIGSAVEPPDGRGTYIVVKVGASPFPGDSRPCAYLTRA